MNDQGVTGCFTAVLIIGMAVAFGVILIVVAS